MAEVCSRRAALSALAGVSTLAIAPVAHAAVSRSPELAAAIEGHDAAQAAVDGAHGLSDDAFSALCEAADNAMWAVAEAPCASDADFFAKVAHLLAYEHHVQGGMFRHDVDFGSLAYAVEMHLETQGGI
jgi:hypothetical protein